MPTPTDLSTLPFNYYQALKWRINVACRYYEGEDDGVGEYGKRFYNRPEDIHHRTAEWFHLQMNNLDSVVLEHAHCIFDLRQEQYQE